MKRSPERRRRGLESHIHLGVQMSKSTSRQRGFTLIEMSIVLVIIGLIIGGILKGQELIENARQKNLVSQIDAIRAATNTFVDRFRAMPGDWGSATTFNNTGLLQSGNDDGYVMTGAVIPADVATILSVNGAQASENKEFFNHLAATDLLGGISTLTAATAATSFSGGANPSPLPQSAWPQSGLTITYGEHDGATANPQQVRSHWLRLHRFVAGAVTSTQSIISPQRAQQLDLKYDDGLPEGGRIRTGEVSSAAAADCGTVGSNAWVATVTVPACVLLVDLD